MSTIFLFEAIVRLGVSRRRSDPCHSGCGFNSRGELWSGRNRRL